MNKIDLGTKNGVYIFRTMTGSKYILKKDGKKITLKRSPNKGGSSLRRDNEEIEVIKFIPIQVGKGAILKLEPLGDGDSTWRITSKVNEIWECDDDK